MLEALSTGLWQRRPPAEMVARWRTALTIKNQRKHYTVNCVSTFNLYEKSVYNCGLSIPIFNRIFLYVSGLVNIT